MSKRILVVEDQPDNRQIIRDVLAGSNHEIFPQLFQTLTMSRSAG